MKPTHDCTCGETRRPSGAVRKPVARKVVIQGKYHESYKKTGQPKDTRRWGLRCTRCRGKR